MTPRPPCRACRLALVAIALLLGGLFLPALAAPRPPFVPQPPAPPRPIVPPPRPVPPVIVVPQPMYEQVWQCDRCNAVVGRGPIRPSLSNCPSCGVRFINNGVGFSPIGNPPPTSAGATNYQPASSPSFGFGGNRAGSLFFPGSGFSSRRITVIAWVVLFGIGATFTAFVGGMSFLVVFLCRRQAAAVE